MPGKKVGRKGKLDQDLPFRDRKTFAIFPKRFGGWEMYARGRDSGVLKNRRPTAVLPLVHSSLSRGLAIHRSSRPSTGSAHLNCLIAGVSLNVQGTSAERTIPSVVPTPQSLVRSLRFGLETVPGESMIAMVVEMPTSLNRLSWNTSRGSHPRHGSQSRWYSPRKYCTETRVRNASTRTPTRRCPRPNKTELAFAISWALKF